MTRLDTGFYKDGRLVEGRSAHGDYWNDSSSTAFENMVKVIKGEEPEPYVDRKDDMLGETTKEELDDNRDGMVRIPGLPPIPFPFG